jgi:hypothetical protein
MPRSSTLIYSALAIDQTILPPCSANQVELNYAALILDPKRTQLELNLIGNNLRSEQEFSTHPDFNETVQAVSIAGDLTLQGRALCHANPGAEPKPNYDSYVATKTSTGLILAVFRDHAAKASNISNATEAAAILERLAQSSELNSSLADRILNKVLAELPADKLVSAAICSIDSASSQASTVRLGNCFIATAQTWHSGRWNQRTENTLTLRSHFMTEEALEKFNISGTIKIFLGTAGAKLPDLNLQNKKELQRFHAMTEETSDPYNYLQAIRAEQLLKPKLSETRTRIVDDATLIVYSNCFKASDSAEAQKTQGRLDLKL